MELDRNQSNFNTSGLQDKIENVQISTKALTGVIGLIAAVLNAVSWVAILKTKSILPRLKVCYSGFVISGIIIGTTGMQISLMPSEILNTESFCNYRVVYGLTSVLIALFVAVMITVERFLAIRFPFLFRTVVTWKKVLICKILILPISLTIIFSFYMYGFGGVYSCDYIACGSLGLCRFMSLTYLTAIFVLLGMHLYIYMVIRRHLRQVVVPREEATSSFRTSARSESKTTMTIAILLLAFVLCYLPIGSIYFLISITDELLLIPYDQTIRAVIFIFLSLNSFLNPIAYFWRIKECRTEIKKLLGRKSIAVSDISTRSATT
ncbi:hypothetical protein SNE40_016871 [Patella caerulea]|uniref:G-protein coupled receptors family 1 profile domain-containing protein n=1 Tax=Patella caerulea TaxID=87958 RepID=A0AAN8J9C1_PATCE